MKNTKNVEDVITRNGVNGKQITLATATLMSGKCGASEKAPNHSRKVTVTTTEDRYHGTERMMRVRIEDPRNGKLVDIDIAIGDDEIHLSVDGATIAKTQTHPERAIAGRFTTFTLGR